MPDVEVQLNVEAETKQALSAIAVLGKALDSVQGKAKNVTVSSGKGEAVNPADAKNIASAQKASADAVKESAQWQEKLNEAKKKEVEATSQQVKINSVKTEQDEKEQFAMEVSLLNMGQLIEKLKELQAAREEAARVGDAEAFQRLTGQFNAAREQMEKINVQMNLGRLAYAQQMQVANALAGSIKNVGDVLGNMGEAAEKGELDLVGLAGGIQQTVVSFQMMQSLGLGWVGYLTLALQGLQAAWNSYAQTQKKIAEAEADNVKILENEKSLYAELATARESYDAQVKLATSLSNLNTEYAGIKSKLTDSLALIEASTRAEMDRLSIIKTEEEFTRIERKYELGRAYRRGDLSEEDYKRQLLDIETAQKRTEVAQNVESQVLLRKQKEDEVLLKARSEREIQERLIKEQAATERYTISDSDIEATQRTVAQQREKAKEEEKKVRDVLENVLPAQAIDTILNQGYIPRSYYEEKFGDNSTLELARNYLKNRKDAYDSADRIEQDLYNQLGGLSVEQYKFNREENKQTISFLTQQLNEATAAYQQARNALDATLTKEQIKAEKDKTLKEIDIHHNQTIKDIEQEIAEKQKAAQRAAEIAAARNVVGSMSSKQIDKILNSLVPGLSSTNEQERIHAESLSSVYRAERIRRADSLTAGKQRIMADKRVDEADAIYIARGLKAAEEAGNKAEIELYKQLRAYAKKKIKQERARAAFTKKFKEEMAQ